MSIKNYWNCRVEGAGAAEADIFLTSGKTDPTPDPLICLVLTDNEASFNQQLFYATEAPKIHILSVALAAISAGKTVQAWVDDPHIGPPDLTPKCYGLMLNG